LESTFLAVDHLLGVYFSPIHARMGCMKWAVWGVIGWLVPAVGIASARSQKDPIPREYPSPVYPIEMEGSGIDGRAELIFIVEEDGSVRNPEIRSSSHPAFAHAAMDAVVSWRFKPGIRDGRVVPMRVVQKFVFPAGSTRKVNALLGRVVFENIEEVIYSPVEVGGLPEVVYEPIAPYPKKMMGSGQEDVVYVTMTVGPDGRGYNIEIEGYPPKEFILAALFVASHYRFKPVVRNGEPVYVYTRGAILISEDAVNGRHRKRGDAPIGDLEDAYAGYPDF
jgi:TonB family protein